MIIQRSWAAEAVCYFLFKRVCVCVSWGGGVMFSKYCLNSKLNYAKVEQR